MSNVRRNFDLLEIPRKRLPGNEDGRDGIINEEDRPGADSAVQAVAAPYELYRRGGHEESLWNNEWQDQLPRNKEEQWQQAEKQRRTE